METNSIESRGKRRLSNALLMILFAYAIINSMMSVLMSEVIETFGLSGAQEGLMSSLINLGCMVALLTTPAIQGRIRKTTMLVLSSILMVGMLLGTGVARTLPLLLGCCLLLGIGSGFTDGYANSAMVDVHGENSAKYMGALHGCFGVGSLLAPLAIAALLGRFSWRTVYFIMAGVCALFVLKFALTARKTAFVLEQGGMRESKLSGAAMLAYAKRPRNLLLVAAAVFYAVVQAGLAMWSVRYYTVQYDNAVMGATTTSVFWVCCTISRFIAPRIRMRPLRIFILGCLGAAVTMAIGVLSGNAAVMLVMAGANGLLSGACVPVLLAESTRGYEGSTSLPTSMILLFINLGRTLMPLMMGWLTAAVSIQFAMMMPAVAGLFGAGLAYLAGRQRV